MNKIKQLTFFVLLAMLSFQSCVDTDFDEPPAFVPANMDVDMTLAELKASILDEIEIVNEDRIIQGIITSSDESGNIYRQLFIEDGTGGAVLNIEVNDIYSGLPIGMQIFVNLNGLAIHNDDGLLAIGGGIDSGNFVGVTRILQPAADAAIARGTRNNVIEPRVVSMADLDDDMLGTLIRLEDVQFTNAFAGGTYADALSNPPETINTMIEDCFSHNIILRNSGYADFANESTPTGNGTLTALYSKYNGTYQLFIRDTEDVQFDALRCGDEVSELESNTTIAELWDMHTTGDFEAIIDDLIIEGVVTSSDEAGNFFKVLYLEDETAAVRLIIDAFDMHFDYPIGRNVFVKLNGLTLGDDNGALSIGGGVEDNNGTDRLARIEENAVGQYLEGGEAVGARTPTALTIGAVNASHLNKLVRLQDVQFTNADAGQSYADGDNQFSLNRTIEDCDGNTIVLRSSGYADFADFNTPTGNGSIEAILSIFQGTYQLFINDTNAVSMNSVRCDGSTGGGGGGGNGDAEINETFDSITDNEVVGFNDWYNIAEVGSDEERWFGGEYQGNKYAEASAYQSVDSENVLWLITPAIELDENKTLQFKSNQHHWAADNNGQLSIWISSDFDGSNTEDANWEEITCNLPTTNNDWYEWVDSGIITLNDYFSSGEVYVGFRYEGAVADEVTGFQLDDVVVKGE